ncbi:hypothetical protein MLD38_016114 [Melastoma candidum]|uniref:Uncharacterized protein n=1 Tax=Melastoma candidum TaxID=119954 RepID=A0ACB9RLG1_9MYRT|nr:hypothetical protein MLD38_016114 [Melastoma candidum]
MPQQPEGDQSEMQAGAGSADESLPKSHPFGSLVRQSSIYNLTLDEFQHALCESGKNFGSMNMDEFLTSIWSAEESQAISNAADHHNNNNNNNHDGDDKDPDGDVKDGGGHSAPNHAQEKAIIKQPSLPRQGSLNLPAPLSQKTVDEVWSEIHKNHQNQQQSDGNGLTDTGDDVPRQPTFGEMTLEDFLIKAGVVREQIVPIPAPLPAHHQFHQQQQPYGMYPNNTAPLGPSFIPRPIMATTAGGGGAANAAAYQPMAHAGGPGGDLPTFTVSSKRNPGYPAQAQPVCYGSRVGNGAVSVSGYGAAQPMGMTAPLSPVSSDGIGGGHIDNSSTQLGMEMGGMRSRKRVVGGSVDKVVERRQRRMIKNRESAARSRARKQAYTVELEAELNQLKEENAHLKQTLLELQRKRKHQYFEEMRLRAAQTEVSRGTEKMRMIRRNRSSTW